ncbi:MAG: flagellar export protein FliJ [Clostridiales bacterium]|jgi:flagellar export protein FliJ|nr:flagellar export protein FliJ [Clostridiales bacterium]
MAKFAFRLDTLHSLKRQLEGQAKNKMAKAVSALNRELAALSGIRAAIGMTLDEFRALSGGRFAAGRIKEYNCFITAMREKEKEQLSAVKRAEGLVAVAQRELVASMQQREMFDKLRDKAYASYLGGERHAEQMAADEIISYRIGSNSNGKRIESVESIEST